MKQHWHILSTTALHTYRQIAPATSQSVNETEITWPETIETQNDDSKPEQYLHKTDAQKHNDLACCAKWSLASKLQV